MQGFISIMMKNRLPEIFIFPKAKAGTGGTYHDFRPGEEKPNLFLRGLMQSIYLYCKMIKLNEIASVERNPQKNKKKGFYHLTRNWMFLGLPQNQSNLDYKMCNVR